MALLCLAAGACSRAVDAPPPDLEVRWLADEAAPGRPAHREQIGGVTRTALPSSHVVVLAPAPAVRALEGAPGVEALVTCPPRLAGRAVVVTVASPAGAAAGLSPIARRVVCPAAAGATVGVALPEYPELDKAVWVMRGLEVDRTESAPLELPPGARLRVVLGVAPAFVDKPAAPGRFRIGAVNDAGRRAEVLDRRLDPLAGAAEAGWVPLEVDLDPVRRDLGPAVRLVFDAGVEGDDEAAMAFPVWGDPSVVWPRVAAAPGPARRNVVLISLDTLRPDRLGLYGARRPTSPTLDELAADSTVFETAIAPAPWTLPSHTTMMTGLHECVHGMTSTVGKPFPAGLKPLAKRLRDAGYTTAAVTEDGFLDAAAFERGFGYYWENREGDDRIRRTVAQAEGWLRAEASEPFFLFVHTYQTHEPYFAAPPFAGMFDGAGGSGAAASERERQLATYDAAVRYTDASIAPLLDALRARPRGDRTLVIVTSDHGEAFLEHGYTGHGRTLHEEVLRVPLLVWGPGLVAPGRRVPGQVGVVDVTPTILDLVGLPPPAGLTGVSLAPQVRPGAAPPPAVPPRVLFSENSLHDISRLSARSPHWKAVWEGPALEIFDLASDPTERAPVSTADLVAQAIAGRAAFERECARQRAELGAAGASQATEAPALPDAGRQRQLKALGYLE